MPASEDRSERRCFEVALEVEGEAREAYLREIAADRPELEQRVRALIACHERAPLATTALEAIPLSRPVEGMRVGPYRLLERLGEGGMGVVYVAEQTEPVRRRVALKLVNASLGFAAGG